MMQQPLIKSKHLIYYHFTPIVRTQDELKDSYSFLHKGVAYMACTNVTQGGIQILKKETDGYYHPYDLLFEGTRHNQWKPDLFEHGGALYLLYATAGQDTNPPQDYRINLAQYDLASKKILQDPFEVNIGSSAKGRMDPEMIAFNGQYVLFHVVLGWDAEKEEDTWDLFYSIANDFKGPYSEGILVSRPGEHNAEESIDFNESDGMIYWSVGKTDTAASLRRGHLVYTGETFVIEEDTTFKVGAVGSAVCTHADSFQGLIRATIKDNGRFTIGELRSYH